MVQYSRKIDTKWTRNILTVKAEGFAEASQGHYRLDEVDLWCRSFQAS